MIVVDASCLYEVVVGSPNSSAIAQRLERDRDQVAPHIVDVEVFSLIRRDFLAGRLESSMAEMAVDDLRSWPGERIGHRALLSRMLELSDNVRGWDAAYVALAEVFDATLLTLDRRLAAAVGPRCRIEVLVE